MIRLLKIGTNVGLLTVAYQYKFLGWDYLFFVNNSKALKFVWF